MVSPSLEKVLGYLIPPASRQEVLGDLHERHGSTATWFMEAVVTIPRVIESRIRRTSDQLVLLMQGSVMYCSFMAVAMFMDSRFLAAPLAYLRMAFPPVIVLVALILADAYADPAKRTPVRSVVRPVASTVAGFGLAYLAQIEVRIDHPELALPRTILLYGIALALPLVAALRLLYLPMPDLPRSVGAPAHWMKQDPVGMPPMFWRIVIAAAVVIFLSRLLIR